MSDKIDLAKKVAERLWEVFIPSIRSGYQVYFCFSRDLIRVKLGDLFDEDPVNGFFQLVSEFFEVEGDRCRLDKRVFETHFDFKSLTILVVAQQILVVEDMVNEDGITEDAYFPRLRKRISENLSESASLPLLQEDFLNVWNVFRSEILRAGARETSITFYSGLGSNKHRSYPISQALFSTHDLITLTSKIPREFHISKLTDESVFEIVKKSRNGLSARGRRVLGVSWLRHRAINQIRSFFNTCRIISKEGEIVQTQPFKLDEIELRVYNEILEDTFDLNGIHKKSLQLADTNQVLNYLRNKLEKGPAIFLSLEPIQKGYWSDASSEVEVCGNESLIIVSSDRNIVTLKVTLERYWPKSSSILSKIDLGSACTAYEFRVPFAPVIPLVIRNGLLSEKSSAGSYIWGGGICVDERSNTFILGYPPESLILDGLLVKNTVEVKVGDMKVSLSHFLSEIKSLKKDHSFLLNIGNKNLKISFTEKKMTEGKPRKYGHAFDGISFSAVSEEIFDKPAILGYSSQFLTFKNMELKKLEVVELLRMNFSDWEPISELQINHIVNSIEQSNIPRAVKKLIQQSIFVNKSCPSSIKKNFLDQAS